MNKKYWLVGETGSVINTLTNSVLCLRHESDRWRLLPTQQQLCPWGKSGCKTGLVKAELNVVVGLQNHACAQVSQ